MSLQSILSLSNASIPTLGAPLTYANGAQWPTQYALQIQYTGFPVFNLQIEGSLTGASRNKLSGPYSVPGDYPFSPIVGPVPKGAVQPVQSYPLLYANLTDIFPSLANAQAMFTASISGTTMTVSGAVVGAIAAGQTVLAVGQNFYNTTPVASPVPRGVTILSGSGTTWTLSQNLGTIAAQAMYGAQTPTVSVTIVGGP